MEKVQLVFFPVPVIGHLVSAVELAKCLFEHKSCSITVLLMDDPLLETETYVEYVAATGLDICFVKLPPVANPDHTQGKKKFTPPFIESCKPLVKEAIEEIKSKTHVGGLIIDLFSTAIIDVGAELSISSYIYFTSGAALLGLMLHLPTLHDKITCDFGEFQGEVEVPGMLALPLSALPEALLNKKGDEYKWYVHHGRRFREAQGIIVNTFVELEPKVCDAIARGLCLPDHTTPSIYPVGPFLALHEQPRSNSSSLFKWLDQQPDASVVLLCFGSWGAFPIPQIEEIEIGLERSGHRFLWSLRSRPKEGFGGLVDADLEQVLLDGFLERTKGRGLVWPSWLPQVAVLSHPAVGGFVSHCGWNSILESLWFGVSILAWPLYAEQRLNAFQLVKDYGLAVELRLDSGGEE